MQSQVRNSILKVISKPYIWVLFFTTFLKSTVVDAIELDINYAYQGDFTDNSRALNDNEENEFINVIASDFTVTQRTSMLNTQVNYSLEGRNYTRNTFADEFNVTGDATATLAVIPQSFTWFFSNQRRRSDIDSREDDNPDNQQTTNTFITGPRLNFRLSSVDRLFASAQVSTIKTEDTRTDSERKLYSVGYIKQLSINEAFSFNIDFSDVDFSNELADNFQNTAAFIQFTQTRSRATLSIDLGFNKVTGLVGSDNKGQLGRLQFNYLFPSLAELNLSLDQSISDASNNIQQAPVVTENSNTTDVFVVRAINLSLNQPQRNRFSYRLRLFSIRQDYEVDPLDEKRQGISLGLNYSLSPLSSLNMEYNYERTRFLDVQERDIEQDLSLAMRYRLTRKLNLSLNVRYRERRSSRSDRTFDAVNIGLSFNYDFR